MDLKKAVEKELEKKPTGFIHSLFLDRLRADYENNGWDTNRMDVVRREYGID